MPVLLALVAVFGWGSWMAVVHGARSPNSRSRIFYATLANLLVSGLVFLFTGSRLGPGAFWLPFAGGILWGIAGAFSFSATDRLGLARAVGTWASINTIAGLFWGALLFGELTGLPMKSYLLTGLSLVVLVAGIAIISVQDKVDGAKRVERVKGYIYVTIVGILWGSYFIPVTASGQGPLVAAFPMAIGMALASLVVGLIEGKPLVFDKPSHYLRALVAGCLWAAASYSMLLLCGIIGRGRGFAAIQPNLAVSALIGLYIFKEQVPGSPASRRILLGALVTAAGGILFGFAR
jgi:glucose uptake protein